MSEPPDHHPVDDFVRQHLDREAATVDARAVLRRVHPVPAVEPARTRRLVWRWAAGIGVGAGAVAAACLLIVFGGGTPPAAHAATAAELVRDAKAAHSDATDRLYDVKVDRAAPPSRREPVPPFWPLLRDGRVWTRGEQFWFDSPLPDGRHGTFGRDGQGRVWVAVAPRLGLLYSPDETGEPLARVCNLMSLRGPTLMADMLDHYDLSREDAAPGEPLKVRATFRGPGPGEFAATRISLELDPATKAVRKAVQERLAGGEAVATFTFTLRETGRQPDAAYELRGHLDANARVVGPKDLPARDRARGEWLGRFPAWRPGTR